MDIDKVKKYILFFIFCCDYAIVDMFALKVLIFLDMHIEIFINKIKWLWICF